MICHIQPNQVQSFSYPGEGWRWACKLIRDFGQPVTTEDGQKTLEIRNVLLQVENPLEGWPIEGSGWNLEGLKRYSEQLLCCENNTEFDYTYGERLLSYPTSKRTLDMKNPHYGRLMYDQIKYIITKLTKDPESRRAIAITWVPDIDMYAEHVPCLQLLDFLIRGEALHCTAVFRSWDVARAGPANMYGIAQLQKRAANEIGAGMGSLTIVAVAAHVYEEGQ